MFSYSEVFGDAFQMQFHNLLLAFFRHQELHVLTVVLEQVLRENRRATSVLDDIEVRLP